MPTFSFSPVTKKNNRRNTAKSNSGNKIIARGVQGIVWIDKDANHYIKLEDGSCYPIHKSCYSCKGKSVVYRIGEDYRSRFAHVRAADEYTERDNLYWLPFTVGAIVSGNIIIEYPNSNKVFMIKKCWIEMFNDDSHDALMYYRQNMTDINNIIKSKRLNAT